MLTASQMMENFNYYGDARTAASMRKSWYSSFDESAMRVYVNVVVADEDGDTCEFEHDFPAKFEVCDLCSGKGKVTDPSIDCGGLSARDFYNDHGFAEDYYNGVYEVACPTCKGARVAPAVDLDFIDPEDRKIWDAHQDYLRAREEDLQERLAEMRYGA